MRKYPAQLTEVGRDPHSPSQLTVFCGIHGDVAAYRLSYRSRDQGLSTTDLAQSPSAKRQPICSPSGGRVCMQGTRYPDGLLVEAGDPGELAVCDQAIPDGHQVRGIGRPGEAFHFGTEESHR